MPVALAVPPVSKLPPVTVPVELINPPVNTLAPVMLPLALSKPVIYSPVVANTATFDVPLTLIVTLAFAAPMSTFDVPLVMAFTDVIIPVKQAPLPIK